MFRHSEIQQMIKAHNATEEDSESSPQSETTPARQKSQPQPQPQRQQQQNKRKRQTEPINGERHDVSLFTAEGEKRTFRRIAREMDEQKHQHVELDY
jgi:hypothetical protein